MNPGSTRPKRRQTKLKSYEDKGIAEDEIVVADELIDENLLSIS